MIESKPLIVSTYEQETAVAANRLVKMGTAANEVVEATAGTDQIIGVSVDAATDTVDDEVGVVMLGIYKVSMSAAVTKGAAVTATTAGQGVTTTTDNNYCIGYALATGTAANDLIPCTINPFMYGTI